jgi:hypothetical protein
MDLHGLGILARQSPFTVFWDVLEIVGLIRVVRFLPIIVRPAMNSPGYGAAPRERG